MIYELTARYDSRKSFYGKAHVIEEDGQRKLLSYSTIVAWIDEDGAHVNGTYSATTLRHIREFLKQNSFYAGSKSEIMQMYGC